MPCIYLKQPPLLGGMAGGCRGISGAEESCQSFQVYTDVHCVHFKGKHLFHQYLAWCNSAKKIIEWGLPILLYQSNSVVDMFCLSETCVAKFRGSWVWALDKRPDHKLTSQRKFSFDWLPEKTWCPWYCFGSFPLIPNCEQVLFWASPQCVCFV